MLKRGKSSEERMVEVQDWHKGLVKEKSAKIFYTIAREWSYQVAKQKSWMCRI
jgi:hypothetical protein